MNIAYVLVQSAIGHEMEVLSDLLKIDLVKEAKGTFGYYDILVKIEAVSENEIEKINNFLRSQAEPNYVDEILNFADEKEIGENFLGSENKDELYEKALEIIKSEGKASTSFLQRKLQIGYNRAARIIDMMEAEGIVSKANHVGKRDVL